MASSDAGTSQGSEYQVFLSFRGPDTRVGFTDVLYHGLIDVGLCVFRDNEEVRVGERIDESLQQAIDNSKIYIPIFSQTYASSRWCLRELTQIMANTSQSEGKKDILPIFFDVEPDDVKLKTHLYQDAIFNMELQKKLSNEEVNAWKTALKEVDAIKGWEVKKHKGYGEVIKLVVEKVLQILKTKQRSVTEQLVGIDDRVEAVTNLLDIKSGSVRFIGIHGMGGIGKTTLARVIFNRLSSHFGKCCCFLEDVRTKSSKTPSLVELQKKLLSEIGQPRGTNDINEVDHGRRRIEETLSNKKVLIVLDDVADRKQVENLIGRQTLYSGSRILIPTRDKDVLQINGPNYQISPYEMKVMSNDHALDLFNRHAFNGESPLDAYKDLSRKIVATTGRLPLALEVLGSFLFNKRQQIWNETLEKLSKAPQEEVFEKLKISYDALSYEQQQIFLDIACFFIGKQTVYAIYMWEDFDLFPETGVDVLIRMSLVKIVGNAFQMHDQLRDLGRKIVHQENSINPGERSRIWIDKEVLDAIRTNEIKKNVQALDLYLSHKDKQVIRSEEIRRFERLRYLKLHGETFSGSFMNGLTNLRWIVWSNPSRLVFKPTIMPLTNVVILEFSDNDLIDDSNLQNLIKMAGKLKVLYLEDCKNIYRSPNFSGCPNLERLEFKRCSNLRKISDTIGKLESLRLFLVQGCPVKKLPTTIWKLESLGELHFSPGYGTNSLHFSPGYGTNSAYSWEFPIAIMLQNLEVLRLEGCNLKGGLPSVIKSLPLLRVLSLSWTSITEIPESISMLPCLQELELRGCDEIQELPALPTSLNVLRVSSNSLRVVPDISNLTNLVRLYLSDGADYAARRQGGENCTGDLGGIGRLSKLNELNLRLPDVPAPAELASLSQLEKIHLNGLNMRTLTQLPSSLTGLSLCEFNSAVSLSSKLENLSRLDLSSCLVQEIQLSGLQLKNLTEFHMKDSQLLERLGLSNMRKLVTVYIRGCPKLVEIQFDGVFESLEELAINWGKSLGRIGYAGEVESGNEWIIGEGTLILPSTVFNKLRSFRIENGPKIVQIQVLGTSEFFTHFNVSRCGSLQSVRGLLNLKQLKELTIWGCDGLRVVEDLDELESLKYLRIEGCGSMEKLIDVSTTRLPNDCRMWISDCGKLGWTTKRFEGTVQTYKDYEESRFHRTSTRSPPAPGVVVVEPEGSCLKLRKLLCR